MNWQDQLATFLKNNPDLPEGPAESEETESAAAEPDTSRQPRLDVCMEKKGRAGKTATIIKGWVLDDEEVERVASRLKQALATGGSARGGEILLQGDRRREAVEALIKMGFKARAI